MKEEIVGEGRGTAKKRTPNGGVTDRLSALCTRPIGVHVSLDGFDALGFCRLRYLGESGWSAGTPRSIR